MDYNVGDIIIIRLLDEKRSPNNKGVPVIIVARPDGLCVTPVLTNNYYIPVADLDMFDYHVLVNKDVLKLSEIN